MDYLDVDVTGKDISHFGNVFVLKFMSVIIVVWKKYVVRKYILREVTEVYFDLRLMHDMYKHAYVNTHNACKKNIEWGNNMDDEYYNTQNIYIVKPNLEKKYIRWNNILHGLSYR